MNKPWKTPTVFQPLGTARQQTLAGLPLASFSRRLAAYAIDMFFVVLLVGVASIPAVVADGRKSGDYHLHIDPFHGWALLSLPAYYGFGMYWGKGRTIGKRLLHIRVVSLAHEHLSLWHSIERALGYGASILEGGLGFLQYFSHPNGQTVHDRIAETIVVLEPAARPKEPLEPAASAVIKSSSDPASPQLQANP